MNLFEKRRLELRMDRRILAHRSGVCLDVVNSLLDFGITNQIPKDVHAIINALGFCLERSGYVIEQPKVGVAVIIRRGDHVLLGMRKGGHASGEWGFPGGHLDYKETFERCALREVEEETGIKLLCATYWMTENVIYPDCHYVTIFMIATMPRHQGAEVMEPEKCEQWKWFPQYQMPEPSMFGIHLIRKRLSIL